MTPTPQDRAAAAANPSPASALAGSAGLSARTGAAAVTADPAASTAASSAASTAATTGTAVPATPADPQAPVPAEDGLYTLRPATPADIPALVGLITELAEFENLAHLLTLTPETLAPHLFGERPVAESWVAEHQSGEVVAFALTFINFSTFLAKPGLYLEDLYVKPAHRGAGLGRRFLTLLAGISNERGYGRFEWCVLDWNENAIRFYEKMGAALLPDWRLCRLSGESLQRFAP